jgi:tRNA uridine 5-carboxymethylaminomethyl modification enzyme
VEAAVAAAKLGIITYLFSISLDNVANMPCNPSIGGTAKGHLVRELDALGGVMGIGADECFLQSRMLNLSKGPAVHSLRVQADRVKYHNYMKRLVESTENLHLVQAEITEIITEETGTTDKIGTNIPKLRVTGVKTRTGLVYPVHAAVICSGTYLNGLCHVGESHVQSGPDSVLPATALSDSLRAAGITIRRFKTGTPCRVDERSIDFDELERQDGDEHITPFSFQNEYAGREMSNTVSCYVTYTNEETHRVIRVNIHRSPLFAGIIEGVGPRYCPSIEDKITRFADKNRHQIFLEPMGTTTGEYYLQGLSSSLPADVQEAFVHTIKGLHRARIMRYAYAIEYDCCDPTELDHSLAFKDIHGLFGAGQFCGTSGYEEAAAQGLVAGINAAHMVLGKPPFTLTRDSSYIGTLIDDLVIKGVNDPYRMMTSRSEYRLLLRQDNADERLTPMGHEIGLISDERFAAFNRKMKLIEAETERVKRLTLPPSAELNTMLEAAGTSPVGSGVKLSDLLKRPQINYADTAPFDPDRPTLPRYVTEQVQIIIEYEGYIRIQRESAERMKRLEGKPIAADTDYSALRGLSLEAVEKLSKVRPRTFGEASRISGVSPADIAVLSLQIK